MDEKAEGKVNKEARVDFIRKAITMKLGGILSRETASSTQAVPSRAIRDYVVITGASQGLGRAFAEELAQRGANLILVALPGQGLSGNARQIAWRHGVSAEYYETDLTAEKEPEALFQWIHDQGLPVSVLINNAGVGYNSRFDASTLRENESCILLNNLALVKLTHLLLPELRRHGEAFVLNVSSLAAYFPMPSMPVYAPSKAFILNFSLALRQEMHDSSVHVSVLCPNGIRTNAACRVQIKNSGLAGRLTCKDADDVAGYAIERMLNGKGVIIPGFLNQMAAALGRFVPRSAIYAVVSIFWGRARRRRYLGQQDRAIQVNVLEGGGDESFFSGIGSLWQLRPGRSLRRSEARQ